MITEPASISTGSPAGGVTTRRPARRGGRVPLMTLTLFLRSRNCTPLWSWLTTWSRRLPGDRVVEVDVPGRDPEGVRMAQLVEERGALEQRLGRDAAAVEARAADLVLLHQHDAETELGRADRRGVAAHPAPENGDVKSLGHEL